MKKINLLLLSFLFISCGSLTPSIAFYKIPENLRTEIELLVLKSTGQTYNSIILNDDIPFILQRKNLKNTKVIFALNDYNVHTYAVENGTIHSIPAAYLANLPTSVSKNVPKYLNTTKYLPFFYDFYQIDVNYDLYKKAKVPTIDYWNDFLRTAQIERNFTSTPICFSGANDETLIDIFGMFTEALISKTDYLEAVNQLNVDSYLDFKRDYENETYTTLLQRMEDYLSAGGLLYPVVAEMQKMISDKLIPESAFNQKETESLELLENGSCGFFITPNSKHEQFSPETKNLYKIIYCPAYPTNTERTFVSKEYISICLDDSNKTKTIVTTVSNTLMKELNETVLNYISASEGTLPPFSNALPTPQAKHIAAECIRRAILDSTL